MTNRTKTKPDKKKEVARKVNTNRKMSKRFSIVLTVVLVIFAIIAIRLVWIAVINGDNYTKVTLNKVASENTVIEAKRGDILDRNGVELATSTRVYKLILDPKVILTDQKQYQSKTVEAITKCFDISADELNAKIQNNPESNYVVLKKNLTYSEVSEFMEMLEEDGDIKASLETESKRTYPYSTLAASVLGFEQDGVGQYGLESQYDDELSGEDGSTYTYLNSENVLETVTNDAVDGSSITTTIDYNIQSIVEKYIKLAKESTNAKNVAVLIQNPNTGEIYAMADSSTFDANNPRDLSSEYTDEELEQKSDEEISDILSDKWRNYCISQSYEPGSTFKPITLAACLSDGTVKMDDIFTCTGSLTFDNQEIHCHLTDGHGELDTTGAIAQSCNVALMTMATNLGGTEFCKAQERFGFGQKTGIDLPNEMSCSSLIYTPETMNIVDLATNSFGQNFNTTMIQMSTAFCSVINGGSYYKPYVVKSISNADNELVKSVDKTLVTTTVSKTVSDEVKQTLRAVVTEGTGTSAAVSGYQIAGKTGTAEITDSSAEIDENAEDDSYAKLADRYVVSFIGFAPYENPEVVCYVVLDEPETGEDSSQASMLFSAIMQEVLPYMNITPDGEAVESYNYYTELNALSSQPEGETQEGEAVEGETQEGEAVEGETLEGETIEGEAAEAETNAEEILETEAEN